MTIKARGTNNNELASYDSALQAGDRGEVRLRVARPLAAEEIANIQRGLEERGVILTSSVSQSGDMVSIRFAKAPSAQGVGALAITDPLLISVVYVLAGAAALVVAWWLIKSTVGAIPWWVWALGGAIAGYVFSRKRGGIR
jgi:hypothetical protein